MKNIFQKLKVPQVHKVVLGLALLVVVGFGVQQVVANSSSNELLTTDGGTLNGKFELVPKDVRLTKPFEHSVSLLGNAYNVNFRQIGSSVVDTITADNNAFFNHLYVGFGSQTTGHNAELQVDGSIKISALAHSEVDPVKVCIDDFGVIKKCSETTTPPPTLTYAWSTGTWGSCSGAGAGSCSGTYPVDAVGSCSMELYPANLSNPLLNVFDNLNTSVAFADSMVAACTDYRAQENQAGCLDQSSWLTGVEYCDQGDGNLVYSDPDNPAACLSGSTHYARCKWTLSPGYCSGSYDVPAGGSCTGDGVFMNPLDGGLDCDGPSCIVDSTDEYCSDQTTENACNAFNNSLGVRGSCSWSPSTTTNSVSCSGPTTESTCTAQNSACTWNINSTTNSCSGPTTESTCTAQNSACTWNTATAGTQTRTIECKDSNGVTVANSFCTEPQPTTSQSC